MRRLVVGLSFFMLLYPAEGWGDFHLAAETTQQILSGIDHLANLDYAEARNAFSHLKSLPGGDLLSPFLDEVVEMDEAFQEEREEEEAEEILDRFLDRMGPVLAQGEKLLAATPDNPDLLLSLGIIRGVKAAVDRVRKNYFAAYRGIRESHRLLTRALEVAPHRVDALWMLGLYDYAISRVPALLKPFVSLVLPSGGGRDRGLERLKRVAREGTVAKVPAMVALVRILSGWERWFDDALPYAEVLANRYPGNPEFHFLLAFLYSETQQTPQALAVAEAIRRAIEQERPHFPPELTPRYLQLRGKIAMDDGAYEQALSFFRQAIETQNAKYAWITAWAYTRSGMVYDLLEDREKAEEAYQRALEIDAGGLAQETAERYLSEPYRGKVKEPRG
ncbi:MAG: tetratricopeptide repeat protein [Candidatus Methylomirabilales bacterium]